MKKNKELELLKLKNKIRIYKGVVLTVLILAIITIFIDILNIYDIYTFI